MLLIKGECVRLYVGGVKQGENFNVAYLCEDFKILERSSKRRKREVYLGYLYTILSKGLNGGTV